jgi:hypothetical protein
MAIAVFVECPNVVLMTAGGAVNAVDTAAGWQRLVASHASCQLLLLLLLLLLLVVACRGPGQLRVAPHALTAVLT